MLAVRQGTFKKYSLWVLCLTSFWVSPVLRGVKQNKNKGTSKQGKKKTTQKPKTKPKTPGSTGNMLNSAYAEGDDYTAT